MNPVIRVTLLVAALLAVVIAGSYFYSRVSAPPTGAVPADPPTTDTRPAPVPADFPLHPALEAALAAIQDNRLDEARASLEAVPADDPGYLIALQNLGQVRARLGDWSGARHALERVAALQIDTAEVLRTLGQVQYRLDDFQAAELSALRALELADADPTLRYDIALYRTAQGRTVEAVGTYERAIQRDPARATVLRALEHLITLHDNRPANAAVHYVMAYFARRLARSELEIAELEHYLETGPSGPTADNARARLAAARGEPAP